MSEHTKEPWEIDEHENHFFIMRRWGGGVEPGKSSVFGSADGAHIGSLEFVGDTAVPTRKQAEANARRIVACVNACAGIPTDELDSTISLEQALTYHKAEIVALRAERDAVRDALDGIIDYAEDWHGHYCEMWGQRRKEQQDAILGALLKARAILADKPYAP